MLSMRCELHYVALIIRYVMLSLQCESAFMYTIITSIYILSQRVQITTYLGRFCLCKKRFNLGVKVLFIYTLITFSFEKQKTN